MSCRRQATASSSPAKRRREELTLEEAWAQYCKQSWAGSRRAVWRWVGWPGTMPPSLVDFAPGGCYFNADPPLPPMTGGKFDKWRAQWEMDRHHLAAWRSRHAPNWEEGGSSAAAGTAATAAAAEEGEEAEELEEGEDPLFLQAVEASKQEAAKQEAEKEEEALAIAAVEELKKAEAAAAAVIVIDDD